MNDAHPADGNEGLLSAVKKSKTWSMKDMNMVY